VQTRLGSVAVAVQTVRKVLQVGLQVRFVVFDRDTIDARCLVSLESSESVEQQLVVQQTEEVIKLSY